MDKLVEAAVKKAREMLGGYGFEQEQIDGLVKQGEIDLRSECEKLQQLMQTPPYDWGQIDSVLHALKGLLMNMGDTETAEIFISYRDKIHAGDTSFVDKLMQMLEA